MNYKARRDNLLAHIFYCVLKRGFYASIKGCTCTGVSVNLLKGLIKEIVDLTENLEVIF